YHRIEGALHSRFDDGVIDARPEVFDRQMALVKRHLNVVGIDELCEFAGGGALPTNPVCVTFDDGYRDNYEQALPILKRQGIKAIFFVAVNPIVERRLFWWDRVAYLIKSSAKQELDLPYPFHHKI